MQLLEREGEVANLNMEISHLKEHITRLRNDLEHSHEEISKYKEKEGNWKGEMVLYKASCRESQTNSEADLKNRILSLEGELKKQRERCMTIIEEKEDEVNMLKSNMETTLEAAFRAAAKTAAAASIAESTTSTTSPLNIGGAGSLQMIRRSKSGSIGRDQVRIVANKKANIFNNYMTINILGGYSSRGI